MLIERHLEHLFVLTTKHQQFTLECDALFQPRLCGFHQVLKRLILTALIDKAGQLVGVPQPLELVLQETVLACPAASILLVRPYDETAVSLVEADAGYWYRPQQLRLLMVPCSAFIVRSSL